MNPLCHIVKTIQFKTFESLIIKAAVPRVRQKVKCQDQFRISVDSNYKRIREQFSQARYFSESNPDLSKVRHPDKALFHNSARKQTRNEIKKIILPIRIQYLWTNSSHFFSMNFEVVHQCDAIVSRSRPPTCSAHLRLHL